MQMKEQRQKGKLSRREFVKAAATVSIAGMTSRIYAVGSDKIRVGLIGCGGRGTYDTDNCLTAGEGVELVAMGDIFKDRLENCRETLRKNLPDKVKVNEDTCFVGWDAYKKVIACDNVNLVILTAPPHFRPEHLKAAIEAGKHVFMEKPVAIDPTGIRSVIKSAELADEKKLTIVAGTQMRRISHLVEGIKSIQDGALGQILSGQCVRIGGGMLDWGPRERQTNWPDMEWQLRRWLFWTWLSGDFVVEMHVHNLDIMNWVLGGHPIQCIGMGGRQVRTSPEYGNVYDHFAIEYEYPNSIRIEYMGAQIDGFSDRNDQRLVGTKGSAYIDFGRTVIEGENQREYTWDSSDPCLRQHADQIAAIREGRELNEGRRIAESTMTCIMGRMSAYTGRALKWDWVMNASKLDLTPPKDEFGDLPKASVPVPGKTKLV